MRTFRVTEMRDVQALFNAGYRQGGVVRSRVGTIYQFERSEAVRFCEVACSLDIFFVEMT